MSFAFVGWRRVQLIAAVAAWVAGCGRVGVHLLNFADGGNPIYSGSDAGSARDGGPVFIDASSSDSGTALDASMPAPIVDAAADACMQDAECGCQSASYVPEPVCGVGYCRAHSVASSCSDGVVTACKPGDPRSADDPTCDGVDDNCNGETDEDYVVVAPCGVGYCRSTSAPSRCESGAETACTPGAPLASDDTTADGVDDDCDGKVDEDACVPRTDTHGPGSFSITPPVGCKTATVRLWGGGGASGNAQAGYWASVVGGNGGAGGYATSVLTVDATSVLQLDVGAGGGGCAMASTGGVAAHAGGPGGTGKAEAGTQGADGSIMGGAGGDSTSGGRGGAGSFGGGGGGAGTDPGFAPHGSGGDGGAATVLVFGSSNVIAGAGGGGGGAGSDLTTAGHSGGNAGTGCGGNGVAVTNEGGGGGGGGGCRGQMTQVGSGRVPYDPSHTLSSVAAHGGDGMTDCSPGGDGYATISFTR